MIKALVFDLDGTLLNTLASLAGSYNRTLESAGFATHEPEKYRYFIGDGAEQCLIRCLPQAHKNNTKLIADLLANQQADYLQMWRQDVTIYAGILELLEQQKKLGFKLTVLSNKHHAATIRCIEAFFPNTQFDVVQGYEPGVTPHKPEPIGAISIAKKLSLKTSEMAMIGDTKMDIGTAVNAGMVGIGVLWGFRDKQELLEAGADHIVEQPSDITQLLTSN